MRASSFIVYQRPASQAKGIVFEKYVATCGGHERSCSCWLAPMRSSVYRWATRPMSGIRAFSSAAGLPNFLAKASASLPDDFGVSEAGDPGFSTPVS